MQALSKTPYSNRSARAIIMAKLAIANYEAGRPDETVRWASCSLASLPSPNIRRSMERMSGAAYSDQGNLEKSEQHYRNALRLSEVSANASQMAQDASILAGIQYKLGQFEEAIAACHKARQLSGDLIGTSYTIEAECLRDMGRFDEARAVMAQRRLTVNFDQPSLERRMQSLAALGSAFIETRAGQPEAALAFLEQARSGFVGEVRSDLSWPPAPQKGDDKLLLWCDAAKALALAQKGDARASRLLAESILSRLPLFAEDRNTRIGVYSNLSRAAFVLGDLAECRELSQCYLECQPNPNGLPSAYYWLGETYLRLGETDAAREAFRQGVAPGIDSLDARRAQARLNEMGG
jgi:tetratricopeptide (TPR) repeat protein